jgi:hypothetical protein
MKEEVTHPPHYTEHPSGVECIEITEHMNFCLGNAVKYIWRAGLKTDDPMKDLRKAVWYIQREIERVQDLTGYAALAGECVSNTPAGWDIMDDIRAEQKVRETEYTTGKITDVILKFNSEEDCGEARAKMQDEQDWIYRSEYPDNFPSDLLHHNDEIEVMFKDGETQRGLREHYYWGEHDGWGDYVGHETIIAFRYI